MDFTEFTGRDSIPALTWLGKRDWLNFGTVDRNTLWARPKALEVSPEERRKYPPALWQQVDKILAQCQTEAVQSFLMLAMSKALANGPKVFQPTVDDCLALENTSCTIAFEDYHQPYPVVIVEIPKEYKQRLAQLWRLAKGPSHVFVHHDDVGKLIGVHAFYSREHVITHLTPWRPQYNTIEDAIVVNQKADAPDDFRVAELTQRLGINFCMVMVLLGVRQAGPLEPEHYAKARKMVQSKDQKKSDLGRKLMASAMFKVEFIQQQIKLYEEEYLQPRQSRDPPELTRTSPKPHWRRGHYRQQACGPQMSQHKLVFIKPILVRANMFGADLKDTEVVYQLINRGNS